VPAGWQVASQPFRLAAGQSQSFQLRFTVPVGAKWDVYDVYGVARADSSAVLNDISDFSSPGPTRDKSVTSRRCVLTMMARCFLVRRKGLR